jgi:hypothetical protein
MRIKKSDMTPCVCGADRRLIEFVIDRGGSRYKDIFFFRCLQCDRTTPHSFDKWSYSIQEAKQAWEAMQESSQKE